MKILFQATWRLAHNRQNIADIAEYSVLVVVLFDRMHKESQSTREAPYDVMYLLHVKVRVMRVSLSFRLS